MSLDSLCTTHTITVQRETTAIDSSGGPIKTWADLAGSTNLLCSVQPTTARERALFAQRQLLFNYRVFFPQDPFIKKADRLVVKSAPANEGGLVSQTLRVINFRDNAGRGRVYVAEAAGQE